MPCPPTFPSTRGGALFDHKVARVFTYTHSCTQSCARARSPPLSLNNMLTCAIPMTSSCVQATAELTVGGKVVDSVTETFGVRKTNWTGSNGFFLNDKPFKILGNANHQDFAAVGVAVPDHLQWYRVQGQKNWGSNGWRTAHNPPTPALLDACDELGYVMWDENHRNGTRGITFLPITNHIFFLFFFLLFTNLFCFVFRASPSVLLKGQLDQVPWLIKRDRNHPSVVIWSICNEVLCNSKDSVNDAIAMKNLMYETKLTTPPAFGNLRTRRCAAVPITDVTDVQCAHHPWSSRGSA